MLNSSYMNITLQLTFGDCFSQVIFSLIIFMCIFFYELQKGWDLIALFVFYSFTFMSRAKGCILINLGGSLQLLLVLTKYTHVAGACLCEYVGGLV